MSHGISFPLDRLPPWLMPQTLTRCSAILAGYRLPSLLAELINLTRLHLRI